MTRFGVVGAAEGHASAAQRRRVRRAVSFVQISEQRFFVHDVVFQVALVTGRVRKAKIIRIIMADDAQTP
jgi:hypothetical protein